VTPESVARAVVTVVPRGSSIAVTIAPKTATVLGGQTQQFVASVAGTANTQITWSVREAAGGSISAAGVYTAPTTAGTYHVVAASAENPAASDSATVTVTAAPVVAVTVNPASTQLAAGQGLQLTATVTGTANTAVTWVVQEGAAGGTVTSGGYYFAPASPGLFHVAATSVADPTKSATAVITDSGGLQEEASETCYAFW